MTPDQERTELAEVCALAKSKGLTVVWQNDEIVVIHVSKTILKNAELQTQPKKG